MLGLCLIQALKNGLSLAGVKGDGTIVLIGAVLILAILVSNLFEQERHSITWEKRPSLPLNSVRTINRRMKCVR